MIEPGLLRKSIEDYRKVAGCTRVLCTVHPKDLTGAVLIDLAEAGARWCLDDRQPRGFVSCEEDRRREDR